MNQQLFSYNQEIQVIIRNILQAKDLLKDHIETDNEIQVHKQYVKDAQDALKDVIKDSERGKELLDEIKDLENDLKLAVKGAVAGTQYKAPDFKGYSIARAKASVDKLKDKSELYQEFEKELS